jgi:hypothetical protein
MTIGDDGVATRDGEYFKRKSEEPATVVNNTESHVVGDAQERKSQPVCTGVIDYFPDALLEVAKVSKSGNDQHNPGQPLHWAKEKSRDEADSLVRHLIDRGNRDTDGQRHSAKVAWRALALLQREIEMEQGYDFDPDTDEWKKVR